MGRRRLAVDRGRRGELARLADHRRRAAEGGRRSSTRSPPTSSAPASRDALLLGMGGSSLGPEVLARDLRPKPGFPELHVLDSTDPAQIRRIEGRSISRARCSSCRANRAARSSRTSSSSISSTRARQALGRGGGGAAFRRDHRSRLDARKDRAGAKDSAHIFHGVPTIGGRYSVLSDFGMVPAAAIGIDVAHLPRTHGRDGALLRGERAAGREPRRGARRDPRRRGQRRGATS